LSKPLRLRARTKHRWLQGADDPSYVIGQLDKHVNDGWQIHSTHYTATGDPTHGGGTYLGILLTKTIREYEEDS
jgi:hypothetical protein